MSKTGVRRRACMADEAARGQRRFGRRRTADRLSDAFNEETTACTLAKTIGRSKNGEHRLHHSSVTFALMKEKGRLFEHPGAEGGS